MVEQSSPEVGEQETSTNLPVSGKCTHIHPDGRRCQGNSCLGSLFCWFHNSQVTDQRRAAQRQGGLNKHSKAQATGRYEVESPQDLLPPLIAALNESFGLPPTAAKGRTIANLAGMMLKSLEVAALEKRISVLEKRISEGA